MKNNFYVLTRIAVYIGLVLVVLTLPWWLYVPIILVYIMVFDSPYETFIIGLLIDGLHGGLLIGTVYGVGAFTIAIPIVVTLSVYLKKRLRFYETL